MRRAGGIAWNVLAALSLLLGLATVGLWIRSYWIRDMIGFGRADGNSHIAQSIHGRVHLLTNLGGGYSGGTTYQADRLSPRATWNGSLSGYPLVGDIRWRLGFVWQTYDRHYFGLGQAFTISNRLIIVPYWFPTILFALAPLAWAAGVRRRPGLIDLMILVAVVAVVLALLAFVARSVNQPEVTSG